MLPFRIVAESDDIDLVQVGRVALGARTPADALARVSFSLPYFCSHELLGLEIEEDSVLVRHAYGARFDGETLHLMSQYALAVLDRICAMSGAPAPRLLWAELPAHPDLGVAHLERWFGIDVVAGTDNENAHGNSSEVRSGAPVSPLFARSKRRVETRGAGAASERRWFLRLGAHPSRRHA